MAKKVGGKRLLESLTGVLLSLTAGSVWADISCNSCSAPVFDSQTVGESDRDTTQAFAGINWTFGAGPELVVGVRTIRVDQRHRAVGARLEATFPFSASTFALDKLRLRLVGGHRKGMYELGGGYSFAEQGFLLSGALQADYVTAGTDFTLNTFQWQPYIGINTLNRAKAPTLSQDDGELTCAPGTGLLRPVDGVGYFVPPESQVNGSTCIIPV